jgi:hypothetical protein
MAIQILKGTSATISETFQVDGGTLDLDSGVPVVTITKPDGSAGPASGTVSHVGATNSGTYQFVLAAQAELTLLTVTWVGTIGGQQQTLISTVEVVGGFLFTVAQFRAVTVAGGQPFTTAAFPNSVVLDRRAEVTDDFEQRCGWSFIPRFTRERHTGDLTSTLIVRRHKPGALLSVTVDGALQILSGFDLADDGTLTWSLGSFPATRPNNVVVEYVRGWDRPPAEVSSVGLARTAGLLQPSQFNGAVTVTTPDGASYNYSQAGQSFAGGGRRYYGIPDIDAVLSDPAYNASSAGAFA